MWKFQLRFLIPSSFKLALLCLILHHTFSYTSVSFWYVNFVVTNSCCWVFVADISLYGFDVGARFGHFCNFARSKIVRAHFYLRCMQEKLWEVLSNSVFCVLWEQEIVWLLLKSDLDLFKEPKSDRVYRPQPLFPCFVRYPFNGACTLFLALKRIKPELN